MLGKLRFKNTCLFLLMGWLPLLGACTQPMDAMVGTAAAGDESSPHIENRVAPIDAAVPEAFETASFGLG